MTVISWGFTHILLIFECSQAISKVRTKGSENMHKSFRLK